MGQDILGRNHSPATVARRVVYLATPPVIAVAMAVGYAGAGGWSGAAIAGVIGLIGAATALLLAPRLTERLASIFDVSPRRK